LSDTIALVAGVLLTSAGLLALLPFVLRLGRRHGGEIMRLDAGLLAAIAAAGAVIRPEPKLLLPADPPEVSSVNGDMEELMAHLFALRMTVSELTAEVQAVQDVLAGDGLDHEPNDVEDGEPEEPELSGDRIGHAA
jgi:hypothetical protein